jgi:hypothetical protein
VTSLRKADKPDKRRPPTASYVDADGVPTADPALAVRGEIIEYGSDGVPSKRTWFATSRPSLSWLPVSEPAFLLWVFALLAAVWLGVGLVLYAL